MVGWLLLMVGGIQTQFLEFPSSVFRSCRWSCRWWQGRCPSAFCFSFVWLFLIGTISHFWAFLFSSKSDSAGPPAAFLDVAGWWRLIQGQNCSIQSTPNGWEGKKPWRGERNIFIFIYLLRFFPGFFIIPPKVVYNKGLKTIIFIYIFIIFLYYTFIPPTRTTGS